jgi:hypothetical protein
MRRASRELDADTVDSIQPVNDRRSSDRSLDARYLCQQRSVSAEIAIGGAREPLDLWSARRQTSCDAARAIRTKLNPSALGVGVRSDAEMGKGSQVRLRWMRDDGPFSSPPVQTPESQAAR